MHFGRRSHFAGVFAAIWLE